MRRAWETGAGKRGIWKTEKVAIVLVHEAQRKESEAGFECSRYQVQVRLSRLALVRA